VRIHEGNRLTVEKGRACGKSEAPVHVWVKACQCRAPSETASIRLELRPSDRPGFVTFASVFTPGPVCTACGTPWTTLEEPPVPEKWSLAYRVT
jgi:hypothetical protein